MEKREKMIYYMNHFVAIFSVFLVSMSGTSVLIFQCFSVILLLEYEDEINVKVKKKKKFAKIKSEKPRHNILRNKILC